MGSSSIRAYFGDKAGTRDNEFEQHPILGFEQRMRQRMLLDLLDLRPGDRVLDIGCGNLRDSDRMVAAGARYFGVDLTEAMLRDGLAKYPHLRGRVVVADATQLPFIPGTVDRATLSELIEHIPGYQTAIVEATQTVCEHGAVVVTTPNRRSLYGVARWLSERVTPWQHPYDMWKTGAEVVTAMQRPGLVVSRQLGAVYTPYIYGVHIPRPVQHAVVFIGRILEPLLRRVLPTSGYLLGVRADLLLPRIVARRDDFGSSRSNAGFAGSARARKHRT